MSQPKPCPDCWVEAQRREAVTGAPADDYYREILPFCPMLHNVAVLPEGAGDPFVENR